MTWGEKSFLSKKSRTRIIALQYCFLLFLKCISGFKCSGIRDIMLLKSADLNIYCRLNFFLNFILQYLDPLLYVYCIIQNLVTQSLYYLLNKETLFSNDEEQAANVAKWSWKSNPNFRDITWNVEENIILHEIFRVVSRFPCYISCFITESRFAYLPCRVDKAFKKFFKRDLECSIFFMYVTACMPDSCSDNSSTYTVLCTLYSTNKCAYNKLFQCLSSIAGCYFIINSIIQTVNNSQ